MLLARKEARVMNIVKYLTLVALTVAALGVSGCCQPPPPPPPPPPPTAK